MHFEQILENTYYHQGFFNVKVEYDKFIRPTEGTIDIQLCTNGRVLSGKVNRRANTNSTARIMGRSKLRDWFLENFQPMDKIWVEVVSPEHIILQRHK